MKKATAKESVLRRASKTKLFIARDGAHIFELFRPVNSRIKRMSIAAGFLKPKQKALPHFHKCPEELYYILSGSGRVKVGDRIYPIKKGDAVYIAPKRIHALENTSHRKKLEILAISSLPYSEADTFFV